MIDFLLNNFLEVTISVSFMTVILFFFLQKLDKRYTVKWRYWLWLILAVRLLIPLNLSLPKPLIKIQAMAAPIISTRKESVQAVMMLTPTDTIRFTAVQMAAVLWLVGFLLFIAYHLIAYGTFRKSINRWCAPVVRTEISILWKQLSKEAGIRKTLPIWVCRKVPSPMMTGFFDPVALIPNEDYSIEDLRLILKHELVHFKRHDIWYKLLLIFANAIHWFNPIIYLMAREANRDIEISCDEEVIKDKGLDFAKHYSDTILATVRQGQQRGATFSTYFAGRNRDVQKRFLHIFECGSKRFGRLPLLCSACIVIVVGLLVSSSLNIFAQSKLSTEQIGDLQSKYDVHNILPEQQRNLRDELLQLSIISSDEAQNMFRVKLSPERFTLTEGQTVLTADIDDLQEKITNPNDLLGNLENRNNEQRMEEEKFQKMYGRQSAELISDIKSRQHIIDVLRQIERKQ